MYEVFMVYVLEHASIHPYIYDTYSSTPSNSSTAHHLFAVWNGDRRLQEKFGDRANIIRDRTSVIPFAAILSGKQQLPDNYLQEFIRLPYLVLVAGSVGAYFAHPYMQAGAALLKW